jgi:hypothetical protein
MAPEGGPGKTGWAASWVETGAAAGLCLLSSDAWASVPTWCPEGLQGFPCWKLPLAALTAGNYAFTVPLPTPQSPLHPFMRVY